MKRVAVLVLMFALRSIAGADPAPATLPRLPICVQGDGAVVLQCAELAPLPEIEVFQVPGAGAVDVTFAFTYSEAVRWNELGYFLVDSSDGVVAGTAPQERGYAAAALRRASVIFPAGSFFTASTVRFTGGDRVVFFLVNAVAQEDANIARFLAGGQGAPSIYFSVNAANEGARDHLVAFTGAADTQFAFEDMSAFSDWDFDDVVYNVSVALVRPAGRATRRACVRHANFAATVAQCVSETGKPRKQCRKQTLRACKKSGVATLSAPPTTTTRTLDSYPGPAPS